MLFDPDSLLVGPRGRRSCFQLATSVPEVHQVAFYAAYELDPGRGRSRVMFGPELTPPPHAPADVAAAIDAAGVLEPDAGALLRALAEAVNAARYWQEPDGEDVLAATPELREPLARIARGVAATPHAAWWAAPLERGNQCSVAFTDEPHVPRTDDIATSLARWRERTAEMEQRALEWDPRAPISGPWWSTPPFEIPCSTRHLGAWGPAGLWLVEDGMGWEEATVRQVAVPEGAAVLEIDGPEDWAQLCRRYPFEVSASRRHDWFRTTGRDGRWVLPDWSRVAQDVDGVHLTVRGYLTTSGRAVPVDADRAAVLAGWDPDQTRWFTDVVEHGEPQRWSHDDEAGWIPAA